MAGRDRPSAGPRLLIALFAVMLGAVALIVALVAASGGDTPPATSPERSTAVPRDAEAAIVDRIVDGDTVRVIAPPAGSIPDGGSIRVRLLNIDAPELGHDGEDDECGAREAAERVRDLVSPGDLVWLASDVEDRDAYDRPLRAMWTADGEFVNRILVEDGWAVAVLFEPNDRFHADMLLAEASARERRVGIFGDLCADTAR